MIHAREDYDRIQDPEGLIPEDEPVFLVRAQDPLASEVMRFWAKRHRNELRKVDPDAQDPMADILEAHADLADAWPVKKTADMPPMSPADMFRKVTGDQSSAPQTPEDDSAE